MIRVKKWQLEINIRLSSYVLQGIHFQRPEALLLTLLFLQVSEKALDYKIWQTLFGTEIPYKPTYLPNTKLARF